MRKAIVGMLFILAAVTVSGTAAAQTYSDDLDDRKAPPPVERQYEPQEPRYQPDPEGDGEARYCERLRYRCVNREARGEWSPGSCRRYDEECGGRSHYCDGLRRACESRYDRGEAGEGNCRRYRAECRDGY